MSEKLTGAQNGAELSGAERAYYQWRDEVPDHRRGLSQTQYGFLAGYEAALAKVAALRGALSDIAFQSMFSDKEAIVRHAQDALRRAALENQP